MSVEGDVRALIKAAGQDLTEPRVHALLLSIAELIGAPPNSVQGPGPHLVWPSVEDGIVVSPSRHRDQLTVRVRSFGAEDTERGVYLAFEHSTSLGELPFLWNLPVAVRERVTFDHPVAASWDGFFFTYEGCLDRLPGELALLPPAWLPSGSVVTSMWNVDGPDYGGISVDISASGAVVTGHGRNRNFFELKVPTDRLGPDQVSVPALLAGLTTSGDYRELQFWENETTAFDLFPRGVKEDDADIDVDGIDRAERPVRTQTIDEARAILAPPPEVDGPTAGPDFAAPAPITPAASVAPPPTPPVPPPPAPAATAQPARKPFWRRRPKQRPTDFLPTMPPGHALELATQLVSNNRDSPAVLAGWAVILGENGRGVLNLGMVRCRPADGGYRVGVELMPTGRDLNDAPGALAYAQELTAAVSQRYGPPAEVWAEEGQWGNWAWKVGEVGLAVQVDARGVTIAVLPDGDGLLQYLRDGASGTRSS